MGDGRGGRDWALGIGHWGRIREDPLRLRIADTSPGSPGEEQEKIRIRMKEEVMEKGRGEDREPSPRPSPIRMGEGGR